MRVVGGEEQPIGRVAAGEVRDSLVGQGLLDAEGRIQPAFDPRKPGFALVLPDAHAPLAPAVVDLLASYQIERHIQRERDQRENVLRKEVQLGPEFEALWNRVKPRTTYRVEFDTETLVARSLAALRRMPRIEKPVVRVSAGRIAIGRGGVSAAGASVSDEEVDWGDRPVPDVLAYLQNETELTRATLARILRECGRLAELFADPQRFLDAVAAIVKHELHRLLVDGIKYERLGGPGGDSEWEMTRFESPELVDHLRSLEVKRSIYPYVQYDSEIERKFAERLDQRDDIRLFVKLPRWLVVDTPVGEYNPDWAIVKQADETVYLVRETKGTKDFLKLRSLEADKVRCGERHFAALGVSFQAVVSADEV